MAMAVAATRCTTDTASARNIDRELWNIDVHLRTVNVAQCSTRDRPGSVDQSVPAERLVAVRIWRYFCILYKRVRARRAWYSSARMRLRLRIQVIPMATPTQKIRAADRKRVV